MTESPPIRLRAGGFGFGSTWTRSTWTISNRKREYALTPLSVGRAYLALSNTTKEPRKITFVSAVWFASFAILAPLAIAQQSGYQPANFTCDSLNSGYCSVRSDCNLNSIDCGPPESVRDNVGSASSEASTGGQEDSRTPPSNANANKIPRPSPLPDFNRDIYYRNKLEFSFDVGWLPINIPFPFDVFEGDPYDLYPLRYTLIPIIASLRWQIDDVGSPWILRGNWDVTASGSITAIPRGAETRYFSYDMGLRRNLVHPNWRTVPYVEIRAGLGNIDAKGPLGVYYAQGQNFTFTMNMGAGARYNFNPRYAISAGLTWMHISNNNLSAPQYSNYGINVYGPMFGLDIALRKHSRHSDP
jgi:Lipid A 3-O-deacylase (PagL)